MTLKKENAKKKREDAFNQHIIDLNKFFKNTRKKAIHPDPNNKKLSDLWVNYVSEMRKLKL